MSLGLERARIAVRPLLVGFQIALLGAVLGVGVGQFMGVQLSELNQAFVPVPIWKDDFQALVFARGAGLGLVMAFAAAAWPVWRAVRVDPVDAVRTGPLRSTGEGAKQRRIRLPGNSIVQFPLRNTLRAPRRTWLTAAGIAAVISVLIGVIGMLDSFLATIDAAETEILGDSPDRLDVQLDFFYPVGDERVAGLAEVEGVASAEPGLRLGGALIPAGSAEEDEIDVLISVLDLQSPAWRPTAVEGSLSADGPGVVISRKAAEDLGVGAGDTVRLRHPRREGLGYSFVETDLPVKAVHANPYRFMLYVDVDDADLFALEGIVNTVSVVPAPGTGRDDLKVAFFGLPGVAAVESVADVADNVREAIAELPGLPERGGGGRAGAGSADRLQLDQHQRRRAPT